MAPEKWIDEVGNKTIHARQIDGEPAERHNPSHPRAVRIFILIVFIVTLATSVPAADSPDARFPIVGETYKIATATPLAETRFDNIVTIVSVGEHQWAKVQFEKMTREGKEKREMWVNFAHVTSAVKTAAGK